MKDIPHTTESLTLRLFRPEADVPSLVALLAAIAAGDATGARIDEATVRSQLAWLGHDPARDRWVAEPPGEGSQFVGHSWVFAQSPQRSVLYAAVDPAWRRRESAPRSWRGPSVGPGSAEGMQARSSRLHGWGMWRRMPFCAVMASCRPATRAR